MAVTKAAKLDDLNLGDFVYDMHDGLRPLRERFGIISMVQWHHSSENVQPFVGPKGWKFPNKELRVIGFTDEGHAVCGFTYDGIRSGILVLSDLVTGPDPRD